ncbi:hypothetical protein KY317_02705 [Candidatus Woesearchaeota archaeon]|nr:hypothetical protein [Candidatus Woesearchaeota archaeon]
MPEQPLYIAYKDIKRVLFPRFLLLIGLGIVFYLGILLNLYLLQVRDKTLICTLSIIVIILLIVIQMFLILKRIKTKGYAIYSNRVEFGNKSIYYGNVKNVYYKRNFIDKLFDTGTIFLYPYLKIEKIKNSVNVYNYIKKLIQTMPVY